MSLSIIFVTVLSFLLMRLSPIDPATAYVMRSSAIVTQKQIDEARILLGMDKPLFLQYFIWVKNVIHGDLGISLSSGQPVLSELLKAIPISLYVVGFAALIMMVGVLILGCLQYLTNETVWGRIFNIVCIVGISIPPFYLAILFVNYFAFRSGYFSVTGNVGAMRYLPSAICLSVSGIMFYSQMLAKRLEEEMNREYIFFARCRGLKEIRLLIFHALPGAIIDLIPNFAQMLGLCLAGAAVVERVFSLPGFGYLIIDGVVERDAPIIHASVLFLAIALVLLNFSAMLIQYYFSHDMQSKEVKA
jgi:peptide/nickel transport system permease protein